MIRFAALSAAEVVLQSTFSSNDMGSAAAQVFQGAKVVPRSTFARSSLYIVLVEIWNQSLSGGRKKSSGGAAEQTNRRPRGHGLRDPVYSVQCSLQAGTMPSNPASVKQSKAQLWCCRAHFPVHRSHVLAQTWHEAFSCIIKSNRLIIVCRARQ